jgi:hypothetical protein
VAGVKYLSVSMIPGSIINCLKSLQPEPAQRSTRYSCTFVLSEDRDHERAIVEVETAVAVRRPGTEGAWVSPAGSAVAAPPPLDTDMGETVVPTAGCGEGALPPELADGKKEVVEGVVVGAALLPLANGA